MSLVRQAKSNKDIAAALFLSEGTIKEYLHTIFRKTDVHNRTELAIWAFGNLGDEPQPPDVPRRRIRDSEPIQVEP